MAGKHVGPFEAAIAGIPGFKFDHVLIKAYAEGRGGVIANGHVTASPAFLAYVAGQANVANAANQFETAVP